MADHDPPSTPPTTPGGPTDASLLRRYQSGEQAAATELYRRYAERLLRLAAAQTSPDVAARADAEDIVQSVFRTFFRRAALGEYELPAGDELWKLLLVIGLNKVRAVAGHHKAAKRDVRQTAGGEAFDKAADREETADATALHLLELTIAELLAPLPAGHRKIVELRIAGHEVADIAAAVGRAKRSVERILQEFRDRLHALLRESDAP
jgi:RNA polymerase sigma-70 factor (ECF subfamily)